MSEQVSEQVPEQALEKKEVITSSLQRGRTFSRDDIADGSLNTIDRAKMLVYPDAVAVARMLDAIEGRPLGDKIFVLPVPNDERFGSIIIPENSRDEQFCGIVVAVGRGRYENGVLIPPEVHVGNYVAFSKYAGREVKIGDKTVLQISECDIAFAVGK